MLNEVELLDLEENVKAELDERLTEIITKLNRTEKLEKFLDLIGASDLLRPVSKYEVYKDGTIFVIGQSNVKEDVLLTVGNKLGISKDRFEMYLDYNAATDQRIKKLQYNFNYSVVLVGPMPHSGGLKGDYGSIIAAMETKPGYPPVVRLGDNQLKITKSNFKAALVDLLHNKTITI